jgi:hypothetical protein
MYRRACPGIAAVVNLPAMGSGPRNRQRWIVTLVPLVLSACASLSGPGSAPTAPAAVSAPATSAAAPTAAAVATSAAPATPTASAAKGTSTAPAGLPAPGHTAVYFHTLPPGAKLPSDAQCARLVNATPKGEAKAANEPFNKRTGTHVGATFFPTAPGSDNPLAEETLAPRIDGNFTGTTMDILRWTACKWGIDQDIVFAQAAVESWWQQDTLGDFGTSAAACLPGHKIGQDGKPGLCPQSYGILQNRYPYENGGWPAIATSTAMNADAAYAIWRACYDGYETWLNTVQRGTQYKSGDAWGCVGRWFAGRWRTSAALGYIAKVKQYEREKIWLTPNFTQL